ncbi:MAG: septal ring lytic transglycosylase RlpA family protein [Methylobacteriaceae bacterium]|nr:septal ring lytic transglycosylase RlpA family protein [Methylobacteriaceae bacterium]
MSNGTRGKEYFPQSKYGAASPRVVGEGQAVPKGGGRYLVGRPYTIAGKTYYPSEKTSAYSVTGMASWYGAAFHGRRTANGEIYDMRSITAAHPTMPLPSYARVTNLANGKSIIVRVNDRGPYHGGRVMDLSQRVADLLETRAAGTARVKVDYIGKASTGGSADAKLLATLRTGGPAQLDGYSAPGETMIAEAAPERPAPTPAPTPKPAPPPALPAPTTTVVTRQGPAEPAPAAAPEAPAVAAAGALPSDPPLPPARPFDLGAPPVAANRAAPSTPAPAPAPPRRSLAAALHFAPDATLATRFEQRGPFVGLPGEGFASTGR